VYLHALFLSLTVLNGQELTILTIQNGIPLEMNVTEFILLLCAVQCNL